MVREASTSHAPAGSRDIYVVRDPQPGDVLSAPLRAAYRKDARLPDEMEYCLSLLRDVRH